jgi:hypothetical protein
MGKTLQESTFSGTNLGHTTIQRRKPLISLAVTYLVLGENRGLRFAKVAQSPLIRFLLTGLSIPSLRL